ncbi:hypothetical protein QSJ19_26340, partial [Gordonia sp. ABSL11-1]|uniref:hypothetical protein n=1 Tax=Gordonia sp. ABSL11-1 TaxID=3053924 RepID=UPI002572AA68
MTISALSHYARHPRTILQERAGVPGNHQFLVTLTTPTTTVNSNAPAIHRSAPSKTPPHPVVAIPRDGQ